jgi:hypothetical protein
MVEFGRVRYVRHVKLVDGKSADTQDHGARAGQEDENQIFERLSWTPKERLDYLLDMLDFEERAHEARRIF